MTRPSRRQAEKTQGVVRAQSLSAEAHRLFKETIREPNDTITDTKLVREIDAVDESTDQHSSNEDSRQERRATRNQPQRDYKLLNSGTTKANPQPNIPKTITAAQSSKINTLKQKSKKQQAENNKLKASLEAPKTKHIQEIDNKEQQLQKAKQELQTIRPQLT